jgi:WD40 repeat protein
LVLFMPRSPLNLSRITLLAYAWTIAASQYPVVADAVDPAKPAAISYQREILPILRAHCQGCHQPARLEGGVDLTTRDGLFGAGDSGALVITPGQIDASELLAQITPDETGAAAMPKDGQPLAAEQIALLRRWVAEGANVDAEHDRPRFDADHPPTYAKPATITALDVSPDGKLIAISGVNETLLLDAAAAARGERIVVRRLIGLASRIESLRFSPDGTQLAVAGGLPGELGELQVWDVANGELLLSRNATTETLSGVAWSPDGQSIAFGGADTNLRVVNARDGAQSVEQGAHADWVLDVTFSIDGKYVVSGSRDQTLKLTEASSGRFIDNITNVSPGVPGGPIFAIARHPQRDLVATGGGEGIPRTYMMHRVVERKIGDDSNLVRAYPALPGRIFAVAFSPDGTRLAAASSDAGCGHVQLFNVPDAFLPPDDVKLIQGKTVDQRSAEEKARIDAYNREGADVIATAAGEFPPVYAIAFSADGKSLVTGAADGVVRLFDPADGKLLAQVDAFELTAPSENNAAAQDQEALANAAPAQPPVEFLTDVMPVLGKLGCNAGTCHGSREGQNGFQLSLRGYNPLGDHAALTDDLAARRINLASPEQSLMLLKAVGMVPHGGNAVTEVGSRRYEILRRWIAEGARYNPAAPRVVSISLAPQNPVVDDAGQTVAMQVLARYTDGSERDVTADAFIESGELEIATADAAGTVTALRRGEAPLLARYEGAYAATTLTVMGDRDGFESAPQPVYDPIDELVDAKLARMKIAASGLCSDEEFLRRVHLDLTGLPPTADQVRAFLADPQESRAKRSAVIDQLIGSDDFIENWTNRWADLLMVNGKFLGEGAAAYRQWIRQAVAENRPHDQFVREIFTATGSNREHPAGSYFKALRTPDLLAETSTQVFLGVRFNCNKCHDHPFEKWTQDNYYGWAAFFADVKLDKDPESGDRTVAGSAVEAAQPLFENVSDVPGGKMIHLRTGQPAAAKFPYHVSTGVSDNEQASQTLRQQAAAWLSSPDNQYFARSYVNRVWAHLLGIGLIEPIDDIRAGNPPTNPELLDMLTDEFVASGFDVRQLIRKICNSRTYQLSHQTNRWNADDSRNYSHALPRRLPAEALYDAVHRVVGSTSQIPGVPPGTRAAALPDSLIELESGLLSKLGRPARGKRLRMRTKQRAAARPRDGAAQRLNVRRRDRRSPQRTGEARGEHARRRRARRRSLLARPQPRPLGRRTCERRRDARSAWRRGANARRRRRRAHGGARARVRRLAANESPRRLARPRAARRRSQHERRPRRAGRRRHRLDRTDWSGQLHAHVRSPRRRGPRLAARSARRRSLSGARPRSCSRRQFRVGRVPRLRCRSRRPRRPPPREDPRRGGRLQPGGLRRGQRDRRQAGNRLGRRRRVRPRSRRDLPSLAADHGQSGHTAGGRTRSAVHGGQSPARQIPPHRHRRRRPAHASRAPRRLAAAAHRSRAERRRTEQAPRLLLAKRRRVSLA